VSAELVATSAVTDAANAEHPLLRSRFEIPDRPPFVVDRPRLLRRLREHGNVPVTLVVGPAGSGKTQLVASWVTDTTMTEAVAWIAVEDYGDHGGQFWTYVVEALRRAGLDLSPSLATPAVDAPMDRAFLVRLVTELTGLGRSVLLVLDGVTDMPATHWAADLEFVLRHTSPLLRLVLIGRWDPSLPLHRYRLAGRLTEIRSAELAFTTDETEKLLSLHGVHLRPEKLASLLEHTEGWAAGLRLFAMALQDRPDADSVVDTITGNEATIAEYFVDEVLRVQPPHVRSLLLETSILDTFTAELAEAVTGRPDAWRILADLERRNAFIQPATEFSSVYRFHRLFAELLRTQLQCASPERLRQLHRRAAVWFAGQRQTTEAIGHAVKGGDAEMAARLVIEHYAIGRVLLDGRTGRLGALLHQLPGSLHTPETALVAAALALADGSTEGCAQHLDRARADIATATGVSPALALADVFLEAMLADVCGSDDQVERSSTVAERALALVPPDELLGHPELRLLVLAVKGRAQSHQGAVDAAAITFTAAMAQCGPGILYPRIQCLEHLAVIEAYRGRLGHAERLAKEAADLADRCGREAAGQPATAHVALAWVAMERYDVDVAGHHLRMADPKRRHDGDPLTAAAFALVKARRLQARGELRGAAQLLEDLDLTNGRRPPRWLALEIVLARARLMIAVKRPEEALRLIHALPEAESPGVQVVHAATLVTAGNAEQARELLLPVVASAGLPSPVTVEAWLVLAKTAAHLGQADNARNALGHALRYAIPEAQRRAVQQVWAELRRVLRDDDELAEQHRILQGGSSGGHRPGTSETGIVIVEPLSRREMEVLQGMSAMLATEEIAARLFVSINTVKTHVRSILRKLSASRRNEAVRRARSLGLI
jgi:LuxR family maltose regulon positive regulatory protein